MLPRRKQAFHQSGRQQLGRVNLPAYLNRCTSTDYSFVATLQGAWVGEHRRRLTRQLAVIQEVKCMTFTDFSRLTQVIHENIARPISFYSTENSADIVYEFVDLDLFDILPLCHTEIAAVMTQVSQRLHWDVSA